jgi:hypothetical protein
MAPFNPFITDGTTFVNPLGLVVTLVMGLLLIVLPRRYALIPVIILTCYMTMGMRIMVVGLNFTMLRILLLFGWARLILRGEFRSIKLNRIDKALLWWTLSSIVTYFLLWQTYDALKDKLGLAYNAIGFYFLFRFLVRDFDEVVRVFKITTILVVPLAGSMLIEKATGRNSFAVFGGVGPVTMIREGVLRCQGPFAHPILAGTFGAVLLPFFIALWLRGHKALALPGIVSSTVITITSGSSGPIMTYLVGILGLCMWPLRKKMRAIRWGFLVTLLALHLVMKAPVWFLVGRVGVFGGSTGYHRAYLIDRAIANIGDWWLVGTKSTVIWADKDAGLFDVTNQYLIEGTNGGLLTLFLFIMIIARGFQGVGRSVRAMEDVEPRRDQLFVWAMGAALLAHVVTYMSTSYFDQNIVNWYLLLAMISSAANQYVRATSAWGEATWRAGPNPDISENAALALGPH